MDKTVLPMGYTFPAATCHCHFDYLHNHEKTSKSKREFEGKSRDT